MKTVLDLIREFRESDPSPTYRHHDESVAYGKFLGFEVVDWNGTTRIVPSEAPNLPGRPGDRSLMYRGQTVRYPTCRPSLLRGVPADEWQINARLPLERFRAAELELVLRGHPFEAVAGKRVPCGLPRSRPALRHPHISAGPDFQRRSRSVLCSREMGPRFRVLSADGERNRRHVSVRLGGIRPWILKVLRAGGFRAGTQASPSACMDVPSAPRS